MNKKVVFIGLGVVLAGGGAFMAAGVTKPPEVKTDWSGKRGTDAYYAECEEQTYELPDLNVNLKGTNGERYLTVGLAVKYRLGAELMNPPDKAPVDLKAPLEKSKLEVRDRLIGVLSNKTIADLEGVEKRKALKQELLEEIGSAVFPDQMGRIESVLIKSILIQ